jgi:hypothetical protein
MAELLRGQAALHQIFRPFLFQSLLFTVTFCSINPDYRLTWATSPPIAPD